MLRRPPGPISHQSLGISRCQRGARSRAHDSENAAGEPGICRQSCARRSAPAHGRPPLIPRGAGWGPLGQNECYMALPSGNKRQPHKRLAALARSQVAGVNTLRKTTVPGSHGYRPELSKGSRVRTKYRARMDLGALAIAICLSVRAL
jgi:hypothetical protein